MPNFVEISQTVDEMWPESSSVKPVNLVKKSFTVTNIMNFS